MEKKINFGVMEFCDTHKIVEGLVIRQNGVYYFKQGELLRKFDKIFYDKLSLLSIVDDEDEKNAKLALVKASRTVLANCLGLLGIAAPERM